MSIDDCSVVIACALVRLRAPIKMEAGLRGKILARSAASAIQYVVSKLVGLTAYGTA